MDVGAEVDVSLDNNGNILSSLSSSSLPFSASVVTRPPNCDHCYSSPASFAEWQRKLAEKEMQGSMAAIDEMK